MTTQKSVYSYIITQYRNITRMSWQHINQYTPVMTQHRNQFHACCETSFRKSEHVCCYIRCRHWHSLIVNNAFVSHDPWQQYSNIIPSTCITYKSSHSSNNISSKLMETHFNNLTSLNYSDSITPLLTTQVRMHTYNNIITILTTTFCVIRL